MRPVRSSRQAQPSPAWTRPGARSARRGHCPTHCIAGRFVIGDRTMFKTLTIRGRKTLRAHSRSFHGNQARPRVEVLEDRCLLAVNVVEYPVPTLNSLPDWIVSGPDGRLWFSEVNAPRIGNITVQGSVSEIALPISSDQIAGQIIS